MNDGEILRVTIDHLPSTLNIPAAASKEGNDVVSSTEIGDGVFQIEIKHNKIIYTKDSCTEILPEGIGLFFVLSTLLSKSLSTISLNIQPALRINTEPTKNKIIYFINSPNSLV